MSRYWNCDNPREHQRDAESRNRYSPWPDHEMEHQARFDRRGCGAAYMDRWNELEDERRRRDEEYEQEMEEERRRAARDRREREEQELLDAEYERHCEEQYEDEREEEYEDGGAS